MIQRLGFLQKKYFLKFEQWLQVLLKVLQPKWKYVPSEMKEPLLPLDLQNLNA